MINFLKNYFIWLKNLIKKYPILIPLFVSLIMLSAKFVGSYIYPKDYYDFWINIEKIYYKTETGLEWYEYVLELLKYNLGLFVALVIGVIVEEFVFRFWLQKTFDNRFVRFFTKYLFCVFLVFGFYAIASFWNADYSYIIKDFIQVNSSFDIFFGSVKNLTFNYIPYFTNGLIILTVVESYSKVYNFFSSSKFDIWRFLRLDNSIWFWITSVIFIAMHTQIRTSLGYDIIAGLFVLITYFKLPFVYYFYGFRATFWYHLTSNFLVKHRFLYNVEWYESVIYNVFYWTIFAVLGYNLWRSVVAVDSNRTKPINTQTPILSQF
jgi:hypothetical protein